jgi:hypothetical protein
MIPTLSGRDLDVIINVPQRQETGYASRHIGGGARRTRRLFAGAYRQRTAPSFLAPTDYAKPHDEFYQTVATAAEREGLQGLLAWGGLPEFVLRPGDFTVVPSHVIQSSATEMDVRSSRRRILSYSPDWDLFRWDANGDTPLPTAAAKTLAATWSGIPLTPPPDSP